MFDFDRLGLSEALKYLGRARNMIISNMEEAPGQRVVQHLGMVQGSTVKAKNVFRDIGASLKNLVGGELKSYTDLINESRREAMKQLAKYL